MLGNIYCRISALPLTAKVVLAVVAFFVLILSIVLSPLVALVALLALIVAFIALVFRVLRRRPLRRWGLIALASFVLLVVYGGISGAILSGAPPRQPPSPPDAKEAAEQDTPAEEPGVEETVPPEEETPTETVEEAASEASDEDATQDDEGGTQGAYDVTATVTRVVDGDTIEISPAVDDIEEVRLIGVDTPEKRDQECETAQPYSGEAEEFTTSELQDQEIGLEFDEDRTDRYGRLLAYVYEGGEMFNERLLEEGYAQVYTVAPNDEYEDRFEEAQDEAQEAQRGIWGLSSSEQSELADRDNGIGGGECPQEETIAPEDPEPEPDPDPEPESGPEFDIPSAPATPPQQITPSTPPPSAAPPGPSNGADCSAGPSNIPVVPGSKGDRDEDGIACEKR